MAFNILNLNSMIRFDEAFINDLPLRIAPGVEVVVDRPLGGAIFTISGLLPEDRISLLVQGTGLSVQGDSIAFQGTVFGTFSGGAGETFRLLMNDAADAAALEALIKALFYTNVSDTPTLSRTLAFQIVTAEGGLLDGSNNPTFLLTDGPPDPFAGFDAGFRAAPALGDIDADGDADLVVGNAAGTLVIWRNTGSGYQLLLPTQNPLAGVDVGDNSTPVFTDLDGDGRRDLVVGNADGTLAAWRNTGTSFLPLIGPANPFGGIDVGTNAAPAFGDIDGDGDADLVLGNAAGTLAAWQRNASGYVPLIGVLNPFADIEVGSDAAPAFLDREGDGRLDLMVGNADGTLTPIYWRNGSFLQGSPSQLPFAGLDAGAMSKPFFFDITGDNRPDLVLGGGDGVVQSRVNVTASGRRMILEVSPYDDAPRITTPAAVSFAENGTGFVLQPAATDPEGLPVSWSLSGLDADSFVIDAATGRLTFASPPDFEAAADEGRDNVYDVILVASDGAQAGTQPLAVTVTNVVETASLQGLASLVTFGEQAVNVAAQRLDSDVALSPGDGLGGVTLRISGLLAEDRLGILSGGPGSVTLQGDTLRLNGDRIGTLSGGQGAALEITFAASASGGAAEAAIEALGYRNVSDTPTPERDLLFSLRQGEQVLSEQVVRVAVTAEDDTPRLQPRPISQPEGAITPQLVASGTDPEGQALSWSLSGPDTALFELVGTDASVRFLSAPDFEAPADADGDNVYELTLSASDGVLTASVDATVTVTNLRETIGLAGLSDPYTFDENAVNAGPVLLDPDLGFATDRPLAPGATLEIRTVWGGQRFSIRDEGAGPGQISFDGTAASFGGAAFATVTGGTGANLVVTFGSKVTTEAVDALLRNLTFASTNDDPGSTFHSLRITEPGSGAIFERGFRINITPVNDPPRMTSPASVTRTEATSFGVMTATAEDADSRTLFWSLGGTDAGRFTIDSLSGGLSWAALPNFEEPSDANADNIYEILLQVSDGEFMATQHLEVIVTDRFEFTVLEEFGIAAAFAENAVNAAPARLDPQVTWRAGDRMPGDVFTISGLLPEDRVALRDDGTAAGAIGFDGNLVTYGGVAIGSATGGIGGDFVITLGAGATAAAVEAMLEALTYANTSDTPTALRRLSLERTDAEGRSLDVRLNHALNGAGTGGYSTPVFVDLDEDGRLDLVVGSQFGQVAAWRNTADGFVQLLGDDDPFAGLGAPAFSAPAFVDLDDDLDLDLVSGTQAGGFVAWRNTPSGFVALIGDDNPFAGFSVGQYSRPAFGDLDGDGRPDLVSGALDGTLRAWRNTADGFVGLTGADDPFAGLDLSDFTAPAFLDFDSDGDLDLVVGTADLGLSTLRRDGSTFTLLDAAEDPFAPLPDGFFDAPAFADLDGDGLVEVVLGGAAGPLTLRVHPSLSAAGIVVRVTAENDAPSGAVTLALNGQTVRASAALADADGLGAIAWCWEASADGLAWQDVLGANSDTLPLDAVTGTLRAVARYVDGGGTAEEVTSGAVRLGTAGADRLSATPQIALLYGADGKDVLLGTEDANTLLGGAEADTLSGLGGADWLDGGAGADSMAGGADDDTYIVDDALDVVKEAAGRGVDTVRTALSSLTLASQVERLVYTGTGDFSATGNTSANAIIGGDGADTLNGGKGADTLTGLGGNDTYIVDNLGDAVVEAADGGIDTVQTRLSLYTLGAEVEHLVYIGASKIAATGNALGNVLTGGTGGDTLDGAAGADTLAGGSGNDLYLLDDASDVVEELAGGGADTVRTSLLAYTLGDGVEQLVFIGAGEFAGTGNTLANRLIGGAGNDLLLGGAEADTLSGLDGADWLDGGAGADSMAGGVGDDIYIVDDALDVVRESSGAGLDTVRTVLSSLTLASQVERLVYTGTGDFAGTGNTLANAITGGDGADTLNGGKGADTLTGLGGDDTYLVDNLGDVVVEVADGGIDTVQTRLSLYTLGAEVETLVYIGASKFAATGNALGNVLTGGAGGDTLDGAAGPDTLAGGSGNDTFRFVAGEAAGDVILDFSGNGALAGDRLIFVGYGTVAEGAQLVQLTATDWEITAAGGALVEIISFANAAALHGSDLSFA